MIGTFRTTEYRIEDKQRPTRISGISGRFLNSLADQVFQNSQANTHGIIRMELVVGTLRTALTAQGKAKLDVEGYNPLTDSLVGDTNNNPEIRDVLDWEADAGKRVIAAQWTAGGILLPLAIQC